MRLLIDLKKNNNNNYNNKNKTSKWPVRSCGYYICIENFKHLLVRHQWTTLILLGTKAPLVTLYYNFSIYQDSSKHMAVKVCVWAGGGEKGIGVVVGGFIFRIENDFI